MSTSNNFSVICNEFRQSEVLQICVVCKCHYLLHCSKHFLPTNKVHHPPTNPPPPPSFPAQMPTLQYEKVILGECTQENEEYNKLKKTLTPDQKCHLNT